MDDVAARGDGSLISRDFPRLIEVERARVHPRADQPRRHFDEDELRQLAESIERQGLLQPILIRPMLDERGEYEIVAGERRWRALGLLDRPTLHAIVTNGNAEEIALVENLQRVDLTPLEEARGIQALMESHAYTQEAAAGALGWSRTQINRVLKLLSLPEDILAECATLHVSRNAMVELALAEDGAERARLLEMLRQGASVKALRETRAHKVEGQGSRAPTSQSKASPLQRAMTQVEGGLKVLYKTSTPLDNEQRRKLQEMRKMIDQLLQA
jgi:ParB family chromosome partitioning protein